MVRALCQSGMVRCERDARSWPLFRRPPSSRTNPAAREGQGLQAEAGPRALGLKCLFWLIALNQERGTRDHCLSRRRFAGSASLLKNTRNRARGSALGLFFRAETKAARTATPIFSTAITSAASAARGRSWRRRSKPLGAALSSATVRRSSRPPTAAPIVRSFWSSAPRATTGSTLSAATPAKNSPRRRKKCAHHFQTLIATGNRLYIAADGTVYAFGF